MGKVFWNKAEIPMPTGASIDRGDGRVFINLKDSTGKNHRLASGLFQDIKMLYMKSDHDGPEGAAPHSFQCWGIDHVLNPVDDLWLVH